ncbi:MAG: hypothetical protein QGI33_02775, partial [Candidatus Brocadiia bacterium]|nr:hypothetical protein [Candidatus Brocadiia bacterium]
MGEDAVPSDERVDAWDYEPETGPLLPRWLSLGIYALFVPWCVFSIVWIARATVTQKRVFAATRGVLDGEGTGHTEILARAPLDSLLYLMQELRQDEMKTTSMARAAALRRAADWGQGARQRALLRELLAHMDEKTSELEPDYQVPPEHMRALLHLCVERISRGLFRAGDTGLDELEGLRDAIALAEAAEGPALSPAEARDLEEDRRRIDELTEERQSAPGPRRLGRGPAGARSASVAGYEEGKVTQVLIWIALRRPTPARGPEKRRIGSLAQGCEKKRFFGAEEEALKSLREDWLASQEPGRSAAGKKFALMLEYESLEARGAPAADGDRDGGEEALRASAELLARATLTPEEENLCRDRAAYWEENYMQGIQRLASVALDMVKLIHEDSENKTRAGESPVRVDHPHLWDMVRFLDHRSPAVGARFAEACRIMKGRKYIFVFLSEFIQRRDVNPVMAV